MNQVKGFFAFKVSSISLVRISVWCAIIGIATIPVGIVSAVVFQVFPLFWLCALAPIFCAIGMVSGGLWLIRGALRSRPIRITLVVVLVTLFNSLVLVFLFFHESV